MIQNNLRVSAISGAHKLLINGFEIEFRVVQVKSPYIVYDIYRKGDCIKTEVTLQEAVKWCEE